MARRRPRREVRRRFPLHPRADADVALKIPKSLDHDAIKWNRIMISYLRLSMIFSENRLPLCANAALRVRIMLWGRARACPRGSDAGLPRRSREEPDRQRRRYPPGPRSRSPNPARAFRLPLFFPPPGSLVRMKITTRYRVFERSGNRFA